jgi:hypothetical protein
LDKFRVTRQGVDLSNSEPGAIDFGAASGTDDHCPEHRVFASVDLTTAQRSDAERACAVFEPPQKTAASIALVLTDMTATGRKEEPDHASPLRVRPDGGHKQEGCRKTVMEGLLVITILVVIIGSVSLLQSHERRRNKAIRYFIAGHEQALARKRRQLVQRDAYGNENIQRWIKEKKYFINTALIPHLSGLGYSFDKNAVKELYPSFDEAVEHAARRGLPASNAITDIATGHDYEYFCARLLSKSGWHPRVTRASGDQGVDIIADYNGLCVVFQCKFSTSPVGNKAVQEIVAARLHEQADLAVVISNAIYTKSAEALAGTTGTILINHDDIQNLREIIKRTIK